MPAKTTVKKASLPAVSPKDRVIDTALALAGKMGWDLVTLADIASDASVTLAELSEHFDDKTDILIAYGRRLDRQMLDAAGTPDVSSSERERLFDVIMERFDLIGRDRGAVTSILKSFGSDPKQALISLPHLGRSMNWTLEAAGIETSGIKGAVRLAGVVTIYMLVLREWMQDESPDLSRTMAALDRQLDRAEKLAGTFML